jgi:hypothetical protein
MHRLLLAFFLACVACSAVADDLDFSAAAGKKLKTEVSAPGVPSVNRTTWTATCRKGIAIAGYWSLNQVRDSFKTWALLAERNGRVHGQSRRPRRKSQLYVSLKNDQRVDRPSETAFAIFPSASNHPCPHLIRGVLRAKNPAAPATQREAEEDWSR